MKKLVGCFFVLFLVSCGGGGGGGGYNGTAPKITNVKTYRIVNGYQYESDKLWIGDQATLEIYSTDPDLDVSQVVIEFYYPFNATVCYDDPMISSLPSQEDSEMVFYPLTPMDIQDIPTGEWRIEVYLIDSKGYESNVWTYYILINP